MKNLKNMIEELENLIEESNRIDEAWENDPENEDLEKKFDEVYKQEYNLRRKLIMELVKVTNGQITEDIAKVMISNNLDKIKNIVEKSA